MSDKIGAEIGVPVPRKGAGAHHLMGVDVKRYLLDVEIAVICEISPVPYNYGRTTQHRRRKRKQQRHQCRLLSF